jgi:DNA topoisomerase-1
VKSFPDVFDVEFTANMENDLDRIETAEVDYVEILKLFYDAFEKELEAASTGMLSVKGIGFPTDLTCPQCQHRLHIRMGRNGQFLGCSNYPECTYTRNYIRDEKGLVHAIEPSSDQLSDKICDKCGKPMVIKDGRYGTFFACSGYPDCKTTLSTNSNGSGEKTGVDCPEPDCDGELIQRSSKRGKIFYGCSRFPDCTFATWDKPVAKECPECGAKFLVEKTTKKQGTFLACNTKGCGFKATSE